MAATIFPGGSRTPLAAPLASAALSVGTGLIFENRISAGLVPRPLVVPGFRASVQRGAHPRAQQHDRQPGPADAPTPAPSSRCSPAGATRNTGGSAHSSNGTGGGSLGGPAIDWITITRSLARMAIRSECRPYLNVYESFAASKPSASPDPDLPPPGSWSRRCRLPDRTVAARGPFRFRYSRSG